ncbi:MAG: hypothetical protein JXR12_01325 [Neptunomonas phycophila]|uniref:hypothetical protein n=1 Tax=Neptunomonas phycophila TaxID=1572645 RepID=UPI003B8D4968
MSQVEHHGLVLPSSPADRKRLVGNMNELVVALTRIKSEQDHKKEIINHIHEEFDIPKKLITKAASTLFNESYNKVSAENEDFELFMDTLRLESDNDSSKSEADED